MTIEVAQKTKRAKLQKDHPSWDDNRIDFTLGWNADGTWSCPRCQKKLYKDGFTPPFIEAKEHLVPCPI